MKSKSYFECSECGYRAPKYYGKCPSCSEWETMTEVVEKAPEKANTRAGTRYTSVVPVSSVESFKNMWIPHIKLTRAVL